MKIWAREVKIAFVAIVGVIVLFFGLNFLKGITPLSDDSTYKVSFDNVNGLSGSTPVYANGYQVGVVKNISYNYEDNKGVIADIDLNKYMKVPEGTIAEIESDLMGNVKLNLILAQGVEKYLPVGGIIKGRVYEGALNKAADMVPVVEGVLVKLDSILLGINNILNSKQFANTLNNVEELTSNLTKSTKKINVLMANINGNVPQMLVKANVILDNTNQLTYSLTQLDVATTINEINRTLANMEGVTSKINSGQGSLGKLINDETLYDNLNSTVRSADSLLVDFKKRPGRYIHFSVFGKRDK